MQIIKTIDKYLSEDRVNEAMMLNKQHYVWFLDTFANACLKNKIRRQVYLDMIETMLPTFQATNKNFNTAVFLNYAKKLYSGIEEG